MQCEAVTCDRQTDCVEHFAHSHVVDRHLTNRHYHITHTPTHQMEKKLMKKKLKKLKKVAAMGGTAPAPAGHAESATEDHARFARNHTTVLLRTLSAFTSTVALVSRKMCNRKNV